AAMFEFKKTSQLQRMRMAVRVGVAGLFALLCFCLLGARLWHLQVVRYEGLSARAEQNRITVVPIPPRRGEIVDRNGIVLASNHRDYTLSVVPAQVSGSLEDMLDEIATLVESRPRDRRRFLQNVNQSGRYSSILLRNNLPSSEE